MSVLKRVVTSAVIIAGAIAIYLLPINEYINLAIIQQHAHALYGWTEQHVNLAITIYISVLFLITFLFIPVTVLLSATGGFLFGPSRATIYAITGITLGSICMFILVRYCIGNYVQKKYGYLLKKLNTEAGRYGDYYLLMLQLFPFTPTFIINTCAGLTHISLWTFSWTTYVGLIPGTFIYAFAGSQLRTIKEMRNVISWQLLALLIMMSAFASLPVIVRKWQKQS